MHLIKYLFRQPAFREDLEYHYIQAKQLSVDREWAAALRLYNKILIEQRNKLGEDHLDCGKTLNDIGVVLMQMEENFSAFKALKEALYIRKGTLGVDAPEVVETSFYIVALMEKVNETKEEANKREKQREFLQIQRGPLSTGIDEHEATNTTDDMEQEERYEIGRQIVNQSLATRRRMSSANKMQKQGMPSKTVDRRQKLKDSRSVSMPKDIGSLLKTLTRSGNNCTSSVAGFFSGVDDKPKEEFNQNVWRKERGLRMSMTSNYINPQMNINLWEEQ